MKWLYTSNVTLRMLAKSGVFGEEARLEAEEAEEEMAEVAATGCLVLLAVGGAGGVLYLLYLGIRALLGG